MVRKMRRPAVAGTRLPLDRPYLTEGNSSEVFLSDYLPSYVPMITCYFKYRKTLIPFVFFPAFPVLRWFLLLLIHRPRLVNPSAWYWLIVSHPH